MAVTEAFAYPRILFLLPFPPRADAVHGGSRAMAGLIGQLSERHPVALLYLQAPEDAPLDKALARRCYRTVAVSRPDVAGSGCYQPKLWSALVKGKPAWAVQWEVSAFGEQLRAIARSFRPDVVQAEFHIMGQYFAELEHSRALRVLVQHDPGARAAKERLAGGQAGGRFMPYFDYLAWRRYERSVMRGADAVVTFTARDRGALLGQAGNTPVVTIPLSVDLPGHPLSALGSGPESLLFTGNFMHAPNVDAARRLVGAILPRIRTRHADTVLYLVGDRPLPEFSRSDGGHVVVTGRVPDVVPYLDRAAVVIVPLRQGGGMRVKVLEALAAGKAVVATPLAVEGLDLENGVQVLLAESDDELAAAAAALLDDGPGRAALGQRARAWACANLGWEKTASAYEELYETFQRSRGQGW